VGLRVASAAGKSPERTTTTSETRSSRRPGSVRRARAGRSLAADVVRAMAGRRNRHECRSLGELTLKGLSDPVETVEVLWEPLEGRHRDLRTAPRFVWLCAPPSACVGREAEMQS
jgi:hypothetical protein